MKITGKILKKLPVESGLSKSQNYYTKQTIIVSNGENSKLAIDFFGEQKVKKLEGAKEGDLVEVTFFVESRLGSSDDVQERWFTSVNGSAITVFRKQTEMEMGGEES